MRWRAILLLSLGLNVALAAALLVFRTRSALPPGGANAAPGGAADTNQVKTQYVIRRQFFTWREVESPDYPQYIANLRDIGCPASTIRDIIVADVNQLYALKRKTEIVTAWQQWWRSDPDPAVIKAADQKLHALDLERRAMLTRLLGPNWEVPPWDQGTLDVPSAGIVLDGPVLGILPDDVKMAVREIAHRRQQALQDYLAAQKAAGKPPDPAELARLRQGTRDELAKLLTPAQLEEYLLRYSDTAQTLRSDLGQLKYFNATPEEFRALFRAVDPINQQIQLYFSGNDPASAQQRALLQQQREGAIKIALGPTRYAEYQQLEDPAYRDAVAAAQQAGQPDSASALYAITQATADERTRIQLDPTLTDEQRQIKLKQIELEQAQADALALGQSLPPEPQPPQPVMSHIIEPGETIDKLAARYGLSIRDILSANANLNIMALKPGDAINVPTGPPPRQ